MHGRFSVGGRVLKTSVAVALTIFILQSLGVERITLAAIVAVVTIQRTFYRSMVQSFAKLGGILLGAMVGIVVGMLLGPTPLAFGLTVFTVIFLLLQLNWQDNIMTTTVVAIGIISSGAESLPLYSIQQVLSALLAGVVALTINFLFTPNHRQVILDRLQYLDESLRQIMGTVAHEMLRPTMEKPHVSELAGQLEKEISTGLELSKFFREEQRFNLSSETLADNYRETFRIFASQLERLQEMHKLAKRMVTEVPQARPLAKLLRILEKVQKNQLMGRKIPYAMLDKAIANLEYTFEAMELPVTRAEFVSRSSLVHLFKEMIKYYKRTKQIPPVLKSDSADKQTSR
ncbi:MAG: aromatic acid exporter family protein [Dethiobacter sp.]|jgi:uncharacterized membrane protein YgaE (UPF0421/DUF939 family)|nr:aromatic acid exporter family protein [Dethiobacter sp.]